MEKSKYLKEDVLGEVLRTLYPNYTFIHNKTVPNSGINKRPDYRNDELMLIIEFDGYLHYSSAKKIMNEEFKNDVYSNMGYRVVRIPYFLQICKDSIKHLFNKDIEYNQEYPHGFIDNKAMLPCDFCELGVMKFKHDLEMLPKNISKDIVVSLKNQIILLGDERLVLPPSMYYIL